MAGAIGGVSGYGNYGGYSSYNGISGNREGYGVEAAGARADGKPAERLGTDGFGEKGKDGSVKKVGERCQTCENRKYQDGSNENVSFKAAAHISPEAAAGAVRAHEGEHVSNAYTKAAQGNGKVISASVRPSFCEHPYICLPGMWEDICFWRDYFHQHQVPEEPI